MFSHEAQMLSVAAITAMYRTEETVAIACKNAYVPLDLMLKKTAWVGWNCCSEDPKSICP